LLYVVNNVAGADTATGVRLPTAAAGTFVIVYNAAATAGLLIYPADGGTINGGTTNSAVTIEGKTTALLLNTNGTNWGAIYTTDTP
jgi:hypothetical protein